MCITNGAQSIVDCRQLKFCRLQLIFSVIFLSFDASVENESFTIRLLQSFNLFYETKTENGKRVLFCKAKRRNCVCADIFIDFTETVCIQCMHKILTEDEKLKCNGKFMVISSLLRFTLFHLLKPNKFRTLPKKSPIQLNVVQFFSIQYASDFNKFFIINQNSRLVLENRWPKEFQIEFDAAKQL